VTYENDFEDFSCRLVSADDGDQENNFLDAYLSVTADRRKWHRKFFWGSDNRKYKVLVLCRTIDIMNQLNILTNISDDKIEMRKKQANEMGMKFCVIPVEYNFSMVCYFPT
jgi:hypothetical protein